MCFLQLRQALVSIVCVIVLFSGCATPYATIGESSKTQLASDSYRVLFSPTGYISWDLAYREALLRCADLTLKMATPILVLWRSITTNSATNFDPPDSDTGHDFYNAYTAYNPPQSLSISYWPLPTLTIRMFKGPIPGVTLDATIIRNRAIPASVHK